MVAVQVAQAPASDESISADAAQAPTEMLSIDQTLRIMDVATTLRKEQALAEQQLNIEETKAMLRERLLAAANVTGEALTQEQVDIAIEHYYDNLHVFEEPKWSLELVAAHLYVLRGSIVKWTLAVGATAGVLAWYW